MLERPAVKVYAPRQLRAATDAELAGHGACHGALKAGWRWGSVILLRISPG